MGGCSFVLMRELVVTLEHMDLFHSYHQDELNKFDSSYTLYLPCVQHGKLNSVLIMACRNTWSQKRKKRSQWQ